jgi:hypothetical protein
LSVPSASPFRNTTPQKLYQWSFQQIGGEAEPYTDSKDDELRNHFLDHVRPVLTPFCYVTVMGRHAALVAIQGQTTGCY